MKFKKTYGVFFASLLLAAVTCLSGCATTGMQRSEKTGATMKAVENDIHRAVAQVDVVAFSLENLIRPGLSDEKKTFKKYSDDVSKMEDLGKRLMDHSDKMSAQGKEYFEEWQKQGNSYTNTEIQTLSEQRRADLGAVYIKISEASVGAKGTFKDYMSDITEIKTYLSNDLTPKGIEAITPTAQKAVMDGEKLKESVKPILSAIGSARSELASGGSN